MDNLKNYTLQFEIVSISSLDFACTLYIFQISNLWFIENNLLIDNLNNYILQFEIINLFWIFRSKRKWMIVYTFQILFIDNRRIILFNSKLSISSLDFSCTLYIFQISNLWFIEKNLLMDNLNNYILQFEIVSISSLDFSFETKADVHFSNFYLFIIEELYSSIRSYQLSLPWIFRVHFSNFQSSP